jgi:hypothetical protein
LLRGRGTKLLRVNLLVVRELKRLAECLGMLQLRRLLGGCTPRLVLLKVLAGVRLRMRLRRKLLLWLWLRLLWLWLRLLLLVMDAARLGTLLWREAPSVLGALFVLLLVVGVLLLRWTVLAWTLRLCACQKRAWRVLGVEGLIFVCVLRGLDDGLVALILLLFSLLLLLLLAVQLLLWL